MATADLTLLSRNDLDFIVDKTTGRIAWVVKASDGTHATVERGYTGIRDITGLMTGITAGKVTVARDGATVTFRFDDVKATAAQQVFTAAAPANMSVFYPEVGTLAAPLIRANTLAEKLAITSGGVVKLYNSSTTDGYSGIISFTTNKAWPTTLPGAADGTGVVYL
jgi:hypothetical protein